jgi:hypothetical protein
MWNDQIQTSIIGQIKQKYDNELLIEHWIHDIQNNDISPLIQTPFVKKCNRCKISIMDIRNKRKSIIRRCLFKQPYNNLIKINSKSIQQDRYIVDNSLFEYYALVAMKASLPLQDTNSMTIKTFESYLQQIIIKIIRILMLF